MRNDLRVSNLEHLHVMHSIGNLKEEQVPIGVFSSPTPDRVSFNEDYLIA